MREHHRGLRDIRNIKNNSKIIIFITLLVLSIYLASASVQYTTTYTNTQTTNNNKGYVEYSKTYVATNQKTQTTTETPPKITPIEEIIETEKNTTQNDQGNNETTPTIYELDPLFIEEEILFDEEALIEEEVCVENETTDETAMMITSTELLADIQPLTINALLVAHKNTCAKKITRSPPKTTWHRTACVKSACNFKTPNGQQYEYDSCAKNGTRYLEVCRKKILYYGTTVTKSTCTGSRCPSVYPGPHKTTALTCVRNPAGGYRYKCYDPYLEYNTTCKEPNDKNCDTNAIYLKSIIAFADNRASCCVQETGTTLCSNGIDDDCDGLIDTLDTHSCAFCGNGIGQDGEECDGQDLKGQTCTTQGFDFGALSCNINCTLNTQQCGNQICGNNIVELSEQCETPYTTNNGYCSQNTTTCNENYFGIRDSFGDCDSACGCSYDSYDYSCIIDQCGATCEVDSDCEDNNPSTLDKCNNCLCEYNQTNVCGNGIIQGTEQCDDGNLINGDDCSSQCLITVECNDTIDNDGDGTYDITDPACHTDYNPSNADSYDALDIKENMTCTDTDGGVSPYEFGQATFCDFVRFEEPGAKTPVGCALHRDFCIDFGPNVGKLVEYSCSGKALKYNYTTCTYGCLGGACQMSCTDIDNDGVCDDIDQCIITQQNHLFIPDNGCVQYQFNTSTGCDEIVYAPITTQCGTDYTNYSCYWGNTLGSDIGKVFIDYHCDGIGSCNAYPGSTQVHQDCSNSQYCNNLTTRTISNNSADFNCQTCTDTDNDQVCDSQDLCIGQNQLNTPTNTSCTTYAFNQTNGCHLTTYKTNGFVVNTRNCDSLDTQCRDYTTVNDICDGNGNRINGTCGTNYNNQPITTQCGTDSYEYSCAWGNGFGTDSGLRFVDFQCDGLGSCANTTNSWVVDEICTDAQHCEGTGLSNNDADYFCLNCDIACNQDSQCDDSNQMTLDTCINPGICTASCQYEACPDADSDNVCDLTNDQCIGQSQSNLPVNTSCTTYSFNQTNGCHLTTYKTNGYFVNNTNCDSYDWTCTDYGNVANTCDGIGNLIYGTCGSNITYRSNGFVINYTDCDYLDTACKNYTDTANTCNGAGGVNYATCNVVNYQPNGFVVNTRNCDSLDTQCRDYTTVNDICDGSGNRLNGTCGTNYANQPITTQCGTDYTNYSCYFGNSLGSDIGKVFVDYHCSGTGSCNAYPGSTQVHQDCSNSQYCNNLTTRQISNNSADFNCQACIDADNDQVCDSQDSCIGQNQLNTPVNTSCTTYSFNQTNGCHITTYKTNGYVYNQTSCDYMDTQCRDYTNVTNTCNGAGTLVYGTCGTNYNNQPITAQCGNDYTNYSCYEGYFYGSDIFSQINDYHCDGIGSCIVDAKPWNMTTNCTDTQYCINLTANNITNNSANFKCQNCTITCNADIDCNDNNESSIDTCNNQGTCNAVCTYKEGNFSENDGLNAILSSLPADKTYENNQSMYFGGKVSDIKKDMLAYWTFDETTGNVADMNGRYDLTQTEQVNSSAGIIGNARGAYVNNTYFSHPTFLDNGISGSGSVSLWFNTPAGQGNDVMILFQKDALSTMGHFRCYLLFSGTDMSGNLYKLYCWMKTDDTITYLVSPGYVQRNNWNHMVFNFGPSGQKMYLNNELVAQNTVTDSFLGTTERDFTVGSIQGQNGNSFNGLIDEFGIWNRNLNEEEINHLYNNRSATRTTEKIMINDTGVGQINSLDIKANWQYDGKTKIAYFEYESTTDSLNSTDSTKIDAYPNRYIPFIYKINKGNSTQIAEQINLIIAEINSRG